MVAAAMVLAETAGDFVAAEHEAERVAVCRCVLTTLPRAAHPAASAGSTPAASPRLARPSRPRVGPPAPAGAGAAPHHRLPSRARSESRPARALGWFLEKAGGLAWAFALHGFHHPSLVYCNALCACSFLLADCFVAVLKRCCEPFILGRGLLTSLYSTNYLNMLLNA